MEDKLKKIKMMALVASPPKLLDEEGVKGWESAMRFIISKIEELDKIDDQTK